MQDVRCYTVIEDCPTQLLINYMLIDLKYWILVKAFDQQILEVSNVLLLKIFLSIKSVPSEELQFLLSAEKAACYIASLQCLPVTKTKLQN